MAHVALAHLPSRALPRRRVAHVGRVPRRRRARREDRRGEPLPKATMGLTALGRGNVIHGALEYFWRAIPSSDALADQGISAQAELIEQAVMSALGEVNAKRYRPLGARLLDLQQQVFVRLLGCWINLEKERPSFSVLALEQSIAGQVGDYLISGRIDRIDRRPR